MGVHQDRIALDDQDGLQAEGDESDAGGQRVPGAGGSHEQERSAAGR